MTNQAGPPAIPAVSSDVSILDDPAQPAYASWIKRVAASVLDSAVGGGVSFLALGDQSVSVPFIETSFAGSDAQGMHLTSWTDSLWVVAVVLLAVTMQAYLGATPGKLVMGIAVVRERDARPIGLAGTTIRWVAHILDSILFIGYLRPLWNGKRKTFADSIMATVVLDTRRPRSHRWLAGGGYSPLDSGPPYSWEAPSAPRWRPAATAISAVICVVGALFSFDFSSGQTNGPLDAGCGMAAFDDGPLGLTGGILKSSSGDPTVTRLGVTRHVRGSDGKITATWNWSKDLPAKAEVRLRVSFARTDGTGAHTYDYPVPQGAVHEATITLPADALDELGDSWTWTERIVVDGGESAACTASPRG